MLVTLIPFFDENMAVRSYSIFTQKNNFLLNPLMLGTAYNDAAARIDGLEFIDKMGIDTLSDNKEVFVTVTNTSIFMDIDSECHVAKERIVLLIDNTIPPVDMYINRIRELCNKGYKFAIRKLHVTEFEQYRAILGMMKYVILNSKKIAIDIASKYFQKLFPKITLCAGNIDTMEQFEKIKKYGVCSLYEGEFYRLPVTKGDTEIVPLKANYIQLLNMVNSGDFDLTDAADIISKDTALTMLLLKMANTRARNSEITSIRHAVAMLGQRDLKVWINTAIINVICADKPNEIMRLSLIRAKFAENLAGVFELSLKAEELFIMGLFSIMDVVMEKSMAEVLKEIRISKDVADALIDKKGNLAPVMDFILKYETADWSDVSRQMILHKIDVMQVHDAYMNALVWYKEII